MDIRRAIMNITVRNPALFDRLRMQALLSQIARERGRDQMWTMLEQAIAAEGQRQQQEIDRATDKQ
jgi:predicted transcriptional regulator